jgi:hypothetical protein
MGISLHLRRPPLAQGAQAAGATSCLSSEFAECARRAVGRRSGVASERAAPDGDTHAVRFAAVTSGHRFR